MNPVFDKPAVKLMIGQLENCSLNSHEGGWQFSVSSSKTIADNKVLCFSVAWIQGTIEITLGNRILLEDGTGKIEVSIPTDTGFLDGQRNLRAGMYCAAVGEISRAGKKPKMRAFRLMALGNPVLQQMWEREVNDLQNFLLEKRKKHSY